VTLPLSPCGPGRVPAHHRCGVLGGSLHLPDGLGLGVTPDPEAVRELRRTDLTRD
jgi:L-alanine-DL-glutamate epimerase-like enolase superfamily enzyme